MDSKLVAQTLLNATLRGISHLLDSCDTSTNAKFHEDCAYVANIQGCWEIAYGEMEQEQSDKENANIN